MATHGFKTGAPLATQAPASSAAAPIDDEVPPWLAFAGASGIEFSGGAASPDSGETLPPWLTAAAEAGVVFYDPEGREVVVQASKVEEFHASLKIVQDFDHARASRVASNGGAIGKDAPEAEAGGIKPEGDAKAAPSAEEEALPIVASKESAAVGPAADVVDLEAKRKELMVAVQKRYFALLRDGLDPNVAAAQAILEAKSGGSGSGQSGAADSIGQPVRGGGETSNSEVNQSCKLSSHVGPAEQRKEVKVAA